jgi:hypothetical protein
MILSLQFERPKEGQIEQLEDWRSMWYESNDPHSDRAQKISHITYEVNWTIMHQ